MKTIALLLLAVSLFVAPAFAEKTKAPEVTPVAAIAQQVYDSVAILYRQDESGSMRMTCTATAYRKTDKGYRFVSASHCVGGDPAQEHQIKFFITADTNGSKSFIPAKLVEAGNRAVGDDFSIFEVETKEDFTVTPLGDNHALKIGDVVIDVAAPMGLGKQYFIGYVSEPSVNRPPLDAGEVQWTEIMLVMIGSGPGSSGSSVVSVDQKAIVGFLVGGTQANIGAIVVPVDKFKEFESKVDAGTYKQAPVKNESPNL